MKTLKTIAIAITILLFTITANSQITKGNWLVGGDAGFSSSETHSNVGAEDKVAERTIFISPNIGYFFINKLAVGVRFGYQGIFTQDYGFGNISTSTLNLGPFVRYYFLKPEKIVNVFAEASYNLGKTYRKGSTISQDYTENDKTYSFMAGPVIYFNSSVSMELTIQYSKTRKKFEDNDFTKNVFLVGLGFQIYLEKDK